MSAVEWFVNKCFFELNPIFCFNYNFVTFPFGCTVVPKSFYVHKNFLTGLDMRGLKLNCK